MLAQVSGSFKVVSNNQGFEALASVLPSDAVLVLPTPFGTMVPESHYEQISRWVYSGGGLLVLGTYLNEAHHYTNLNQLVRRFGFEFCHDLTMPKGKETFHDCMSQAFAYADSGLWISTKPRGEPESHEILSGVSSVTLTSCCTIDCASPPELTLFTSDPVALFRARGNKDPSSGRLLQITDYVLEGRKPVPFLIALAYGSGRVVAIGTWKIFVNELVRREPDGNARLFRNLVRWLAPKHNLASPSA